MAILNLEIDGSNMTPVNGQYTFTTNFYSLLTGNPITDSRFPQNQIYTTSNFVEPYFIPVEIADGEYTIQNIEARVSYKNLVVAAGLHGRNVSCNGPCTALPIVSLNFTSNVLSVSLSAASTNTYSWRLLNSSSTVVASGTSNVTTTSFNIVVPPLNAGSYLLELVGNNCSGRSIKNFTVASGGLPQCGRGPTIENILSSTPTSLQYQFDGQGIFGMSWRIKSGNVVVRSGSVKHTSVAQQGDVTFNGNIVNISYSTLSTGNYTLEIEGNLCQSLTVSTRAFTITNVEVPLAFANGSPTVTGNQNNYTFTIFVNKSGTYLTTILDIPTGTYYHNANVTYTVGTPFIKTGLPEGNYLIKVDTLESIKNISEGGGGTSGDLYFSVYYAQ